MYVCVCVCVCVVKIQRNVFETNKEAIITNPNGSGRPWRQRTWSEMTYVVHVLIY